MVNAILLLAIGLMASVGLGCLLTALQRWVLRPPKNLKMAVVLPVFGAEPDMERRLRSAYESLLQGSFGETPPLLLLADFGADADTLELCRLFCEDRTGVELCDAEELPLVVKALPEPGRDARMESTAHSAKPA